MDYAGHHEDLEEVVMCWYMEQGDSFMPKPLYGQWPPL